MVTDLKSGLTTNWISLKSFGREIGISPSTIVPLIRFSKKNPIMGRYVVELRDVDEVLTSNTVNFGRPIFVFDVLTREMRCYDSVLLASYETCVRSLSNLNRAKLPMFIAGFFFHYDKEKIPKNFGGDLMALSLERKKYRLRPFNQRQSWFEIYDYYSQVTYRAETLDDFTHLLNSLPPNNVVYEKGKVSQKLGNGPKAKRTSIAKGYGIRSDKCDYPWFPFNEEILLSSAKCFQAPKRFYRLLSQEGEEIICGTKNLCNFIGYKTTLREQNIPIDIVFKFGEDKGYTIERLNKPVKSH